MSTKKSTTTQISVSQELKEEKQISTLQNSGVSEERVDALEKKINALIDILNSNPSVTANCPKNTEGKRQIIL